MLITGRQLFLWLSILVIVAGITMIAALPSSTRWVGLLTALGGLGGCFAVVSFSRPWSSTRDEEADHMDQVPVDRRRELMRGTSMHLREMRYRYSVRQPTEDSGDQRCFTAEVNSIRLGFVPAIITDNTTDRQGRGFVAFVYDGKRWRGPGLPCPGGQHQAVRHAARCDSPLSTDEETRY